MTSLTESDVEAAALEWLAGLGWGIAHGAEIAPGAPGAERADYGAVVLERRLRDALARLNPELPLDALDDAFRKLTLPSGATLDARNRGFHRLLVDGVTVEYRTAGGAIRGAQARAVDFEQPGNNDWLAVNQFIVTEDRRNRRPDIVLFVNGLPLGVIELKNPSDADATVWTAWQQLQTYKAELPDALLDERVAHRLGRARGAHRHADRRAGVVQALAHGHRRGARGGRRAGAAGDAGGRLRAAAAAPADPRLHRLRGRRRRRAGQEDGRLSPVPRRAGRGPRDPAGRGTASRGAGDRRGRWALRVGAARAATRATAASASSGTRRAPARA